MPKAPPLPEELTASSATQPMSIKTLGLPVPEECIAQAITQPNRRVLECAARFEPSMPADWNRVGDLPIWTSQGRSVAQSWAQRGARWWLTQSLHQSKGDHDSEDSGSGSVSSEGPQ